MPTTAKGKATKGTSCWGIRLTNPSALTFKSCNNEAMVASMLAYQNAPAVKCCTNWSLNTAAWGAIA